MGQCSTLPTEGNQKAEGAVSSSTMGQGKSSRSYSQKSSSGYSRQPAEQRDTSYNDRQSSNDKYYARDVDMNSASPSRSQRDMKRLVNAAKQNNEKSEQFVDNDGKSYGTPPSSSSKTSSRRRYSRKTEAEPAEEPFPAPPEGAVRTRCYRLNLDAPVVLSPTHDHLGPMPYEPPAHLRPNNNASSRRRQDSWHSAADAMMTLDVNHSGSVDEEKSTTQVAINTARIFRGITIDKNGVILSQNARASRSSRGKDRSKQGEKSRQAAKIDKAKDLVDEALGSGKENDGEKSNMVSLVIVGEYDEMKQLVRDGAKKLRDAEGLPDEALLSINRPRKSYSRRDNIQSSTSPSSRKRFPSPYTTHSTPENPARSRSKNKLLPHSAPPKLKGHPRDRPNSRRTSGTDSHDDRSARFPGEKCNDIPLFGGGDSDWSEALNFSNGFNSIWGCGNTGKHGDKLSPKTNSGSARQIRYEGRNAESSTRFSRGGGVAAERDAPGSKDVVII